MKHKNFKPRKNWKPKQQQDKKIPKPNGREIPVINGNGDSLVSVPTVVVVFILSSHANTGAARVSVPNVTC